MGTSSGGSHASLSLSLSLSLSQFIESQLAWGKLFDFKSRTCLEPEIQYLL